MIFCTKVIQKAAKQMPVNLVQDNVKYQEKGVLCRDLHFTKSMQETRRRFLSNFNLNHWQLKLAYGSKSVHKWVKKFRNLGTVDKSKSPGKHRTARPPPSSKLPPPSSRARKLGWHRQFGTVRRRIGRTTLRRTMKENIHSCENKINNIFLHDPSQSRSPDAPVPGAK